LTVPGGKYTEVRCNAGYTLSGRKGSEYRVNESAVREFLARVEHVA
jgi:hypothetical protein